MEIELEILLLRLLHVKILQVISGKRGLLLWLLTLKFRCLQYLQLLDSTWTEPILEAFLELLRCSWLEAMLKAQAMKKLDQLLRTGVGVAESLLLDLSTTGVESELEPDAEEVTTARTKAQLLLARRKDSSERSGNFSRPICRDSPLQLKTLLVIELQIDNEALGTLVQTPTSDLQELKILRSLEGLAS